MGSETRGFIVTLDPDGRVVLPPTALTELRWSPGMQLMVLQQAGGLMLRLGPLEGER